MKTITILLALFAGYFVFQIARESLGFGIMCGCISFIILCWLNSGTKKPDERKHRIRYEQGEELRK